MPSPHDHAYFPPPTAASRSPCPALNALANHGYLPRDGRNLSIWQLIRAMMLVYNLSFPLALLLAFFGVLTCGRWFRLDLHDLAKHNVIEHNGSLTHADAAPGARYAPVAPDPARTAQLLATTPAPALTLHDFATARAMRDAGIATPLDVVHAEIARGEVALTVAVMGEDPRAFDIDEKGHDVIPHERSVPKTFIREWYLEERLPDGWKRPSQQVGLCSVKACNKVVQTMIVQARKQLAPEGQRPAQA